MAQGNRGAVGAVPEPGQPAAPGVSRTRSAGSVTPCDSLSGCVSGRRGFVCLSAVRFHFRVCALSQRVLTGLGRCQRAEEQTRSQVRAGSEPRRRCRRVCVLCRDLSGHLPEPPTAPAGGFLARGHAPAGPCSGRTGVARTAFSWGGAGAAGGRPLQTPRVHTGPSWARLTLCRLLTKTSWGQGVPSFPR